MKTNSIGMEMVYFIFPCCDGNCGHCWSHDLMLGRYKNYDWHKKLINSLCTLNYNYRVIKISGGEPFLNKDIGLIINYIRTNLAPNAVIEIFTSGRQFVSFTEGKLGVEETKKQLLKYIDDFDNVSLQLSADEFHLQVLQEKFSWKPSEIIKLYKQYLSNFINACIELKKEYKKFIGPKLKIHCLLGRGEYHKKILLDWVPFEWWKYIELTEGLVCSGNAKTMENTFKIKPSNIVSYFLLPGVDFYNRPVTINAVKFTKGKDVVYLDESTDSAVLIEGWWNLIERNAKYKRIDVI